MYFSQGARSLGKEFSLNLSCSLAMKQTSCLGIVWGLIRAL